MSRLKKSKELKLSTLVRMATKMRESATQAHGLPEAPNFIKPEDSLFTELGNSSRERVLLPASTSGRGD